MVNAILYARVSTDEQAAKGASIPYQKERMEQYCALMEYTAVKYVAEDYSAKSFDNRPEFNKLLDFIKANKGLVQKLLIVRWDRFSRNATEAYNMIARLAKMGVEVNAIEQPLDLNVPENKMMLAFYLAAPEVENDRRSINTINGMRKNRKQGRWLGVAPIGYKNARDSQDKPILLKSEDAPLVQKAFELYATGNYPFEILRKQLNKEGLVMAKSQFNRLLRNSIYCGKVEVKAFRNEPEEIVNGIHEPIVSEELFNDVQQVISGKKRFTAKNTKVRMEFPMRGYLICNSCGGNLTASCSQGRNEKYYYYHCQPGCKERIDAKTIHTSFDQWLAKLSMKPDSARLYLAVMEHIFKTNEIDREAEIELMEKEINKKSEMLAKATMKFVNDELDKDNYNKLKEVLQNEMANLKAEIIEFKGMESGFMECMTYGITFLSKLPFYYSTATLENKQKMLGSIFPEKLIFSENTYRTAEPNEIVDFLSTIDATFKNNKDLVNPEKSDISCRVPGAGIEPAYCCQYWFLRPARLPVPPSGQKGMRN
jgi:site-specific DNA recombinase